MPIYEYRCGSCSHELEALQKISDSPLRKCPECGKLTLRRLISAPVFRMKGGGWYETDFKSDKEEKRNLHGAEKEEAKADGKAEAKADVKADAKAAGKGEAKEAKGAAKETKESKPAARRARAAARPAARPKSARKKGARRARRTQDAC